MRNPLHFTRGKHMRHDEAVVQYAFFGLLNAVGAVVTGFIAIFRVIALFIYLLISMVQLVVGPFVRMAHRALLRADSNSGVHAEAIMADAQ